MLTFYLQRSHGFGHNKPVFFPFISMYHLSRTGKYNETSVFNRFAWKRAVSTSACCNFSSAMVSVQILSKNIKPKHATALILTEVCGS